MADATERWLDELERCLHRLSEEHEGLLDLIRRKQRAMQMGQPQLVTDCCERENAHVQRIGGLEGHRQKAVGELTALLGEDARSDQPLTLRAIAERIEEPRRGRLLVLHQRLRQTMEQVQRENRVARGATEGLLHHVRGVIQQVTQAVGGAGTYSRQGPVEAPPDTASSFTVTG
jgi:hypothetical protein